MTFLATRRQATPHVVGAMRGALTTDYASEKATSPVDRALIDPGVLLARTIVRTVCYARFVNEWTSGASRTDGIVVNKNGGMGLQLCNWGTSTFVRDEGNTGNTPGGCDNTSAYFTVAGRTNIILHDYQAVDLQNGQSSAVLIYPNRPLPTQAAEIASGNQDSTSTSTISTAATVTVTASATSSHDDKSGKYTAAVLAGDAIGIGLPLLLALVATLVVISSLRKRLQRASGNRATTAGPWETGQMHSPSKRQSLAFSAGGPPGELDATR
jgi:hypothetical protein